MREKIVSADIIECVLGVGASLFYNSTMEACVIVCRMQKPPERKGKILFINAIDEVTVEKTQSFMEDHHRKKILDAYNSFTGIEGFSKVISVEEIQKNQSRLKISDYLHINHHARVDEPLEDLIDDWQSSNHNVRQALDALITVTKEAGLYD